MKKIIIYILVCLPVVGFMSCDYSEKTIIQERSIDLFCDNFIQSHSNWKQNQIINEKANNDLEDSLKANLSSGLLSDFPLKLYRINEYEPGKFAAHLNTDYSIKTKYNFTFDVIALVLKQDVAELKSDSSYAVSGNFKKFLLDDYRNYSDGLANTPKVQIKKSDDSIPIIDLGIILMDNVTLKRID